MNKYDNSRKRSRLASFPTVSIENREDQLTAKCKFNFSYMDFAQPAGQRFDDWSNDQLVKLLNKLVEYTKQPLKYWRTQAQRVGRRSHNVLELYDAFPLKSDFIHPKHVPHEAHWGRFRLENLVRLIGFVIPDDCQGKIHEGTKIMFDCNTFYVVFLDKNHRFWLTDS